MPKYRENLFFMFGIRADWMAPGRSGVAVYFCATAPVAVPLRLLVNRSAWTGDTVPWNEYLPEPRFVMVPISWPVAALKRVSVAVGVVLVASTLRLRVLTTNSALVILTLSTVFGTVTVWVIVTPPKIAENVTGVSTPTGVSGTFSVINRK